MGGAEALNRLTDVFHAHALKDASDEVGLPTDPEFRAVFAYYVEWGTRMALIYSGPNPPPVDAAEIPVWSWVRPRPGSRRASLHRAKSGPAKG